MGAFSPFSRGSLRRAGLKASAPGLAGEQRCRATVLPTGMISELPWPLVETRPSNTRASGGTKHPALWNANAKRTPHYY